MRNILRVDIILTRVGSVDTARGAAVAEVSHAGGVVHLYAIDQEPVVVEARGEALELGSPVALAVIDHIDGLSGEAIATLHLHLLGGL